MREVIKGIKGLGDLLQLVAPTIEGLYDVSVRVGGRTSPTLPPTLPRAGSIPRVVRRRTPADDTREPVVDVFDEADSVIVVAQLPGVEERAVQWSCRERHLTIRAGSADRKYAKDLELPAAVGDEQTVSSFVNGVLEITLWKRR